MQPRHRLRLALEAPQLNGVGDVGFDQRERALPVEGAVLHEVDDLLPALAKDGTHRVPSVAEGELRPARHCHAG
jgi:hypothetical protein